MSPTFASNDPTKEFSVRYHLPKHWVLDPTSMQGIDYYIYTGIALSLLPPPPARVLDAGCGDGRVAAMMVDRGYDVVGVDSAETGLRWARTLVSHARFEQLDLRLLSHRPEFQASFDAVVCIEVLEHIPPSDQMATLAAIAACLRAGGTLVLTVPSVNIPVTHWHYKHYTADEIQNMVMTVGLAVKQLICQRPNCWVFSPKVWRLFYNRYYDLRAVRHLIRLIANRYYATTDNPDKAGRYILQACSLPRDA